MSKRETITITMRRDTHAQLKSLAGQQGISMMQYLEKLVGYIKRSGIDIDAPMTHEPNKQLVAVKKQTDYLVRIIKNLESKTLDPLCHSVFGIERSLHQKNSLTKGLLCPKCQKPYAFFQVEDASWICGNCQFRVRKEMGTLILEEVDFITLLGGGMTRWLGTIPTPSGMAISGRLYLDKKDHYDLKVWQDVHQNQPI